MHCLPRSIVTLCFGIVLLTSGTARAADSCQPVFDAVEKLITTPNHSYTTTSGADRAKPRDTESILADGEKYIGVNGKWRKVGITTTEILEQEKENERTGHHSCQFVRTEAVKGEPASVYHLQQETEDSKEDSQIWISKSSGLPLREEQVMDAGDAHQEHRSAHFDYTNIHSPL